MITVTGKPVCAGVAFGPVFVFSREESTIKRRHIESSEDEILRFENARKKAIEELDILYNKAIAEVGEANAMIFRIHQMMLDDLDYIESVRNIITDQLLNAETAVGQTCDSFVQLFRSMDDSYMRERSADVKDVSERLIQILSGKNKNAIVSDEPSIIIADDLAPSETVQFDKEKILAFVTEGGSTNSHTAILARMMNIPAMIGAEGSLRTDFDGKAAIVDGFTGTIYIEPDEKTIAKMTAKKREIEKQTALLEKLRGEKSVTKDGQRIELCANIGNVIDVASVLKNDAEGIGLFRSEFLYLESRNYPSEDVQFGVYKEVLSKMENKRVIIRTLDIGADKQANYFHLPREENPALGLRAIRFCLQHPDIFKTQLRALYRASVFGHLSIMFPMIVSEWEVLKVLEIIKEVKGELASEGISYAKNVELGCMIETPAAALISDILSKHLDFFSIGTNDLTQYTLAADRQNPDIDSFRNDRHIAILRLINTVTENAHKNGAWVGICGELAADVELTELFLAIGIDELSVIPSLILPLRKKIAETDVSAIKDRVLSKYLM
ncbi:MAG: phosphoenolpyruvate--protein phosphotransferase [Oscillospiraceae bacterium]|nr:phosphoenolpyruvate--protein phosphotransferase [Oscillospiraceae bacterium]